VKGIGRRDGIIPATEITSPISSVEKLRPPYFRSLTAHKESI
jgi:hypothetical protein